MKVEAFRGAEWKTKKLRYGPELGIAGDVRTRPKRKRNSNGLSGCTGTRKNNKSKS